MSRINVLVAVTSPDLMAEGIAVSIEARSDMALVEHRWMTVAEIESALASVSPSAPCALMLIGLPTDTNETAQQWLDMRSDLVVLQIDLAEGLVRIALRDPRLDSLLSALRGLVERVASTGHERFARIQLPPTHAATAPNEGAASRPLLEACVDWVNHVLRDAIRATADDGEIQGFTASQASLLRALDSLADRERNTREHATVTSDIALELALGIADVAVEPLARAAAEFALSATEFRFLVLALSPEFDARFQRCIGFLLDDMGRRVGTPALYHMLLGTPRASSNRALARWLAFEEVAGRPAAADEPLRCDPYLAQWLLGDPTALAADPCIRRVLRTMEWSGASLVGRREDLAMADGLVASLAHSAQSSWVVLGGDDAAAWRSLVEVGASRGSVTPLRIEPGRLVPGDLVATAEAAVRIARLARLSGNPVVIDVADEGSADDELRLLLATLARFECRAAVICRDEARVARLLGSVDHRIWAVRPVGVAAREAAVQMAASRVGAHVTDESASLMARRYPLALDGLEDAMRLARTRADDPRNSDAPLERFTTACRDVAASKISHLADRIDPAFDLDDVVLPADRRQQLVEIVDNVRLAGRVLDDWKFGEQLQYGRGVGALFFGPSGTGKTMAASGIARRLGVQLLRLDLSRVVSKYIGDTEKNIDQVFNDAEWSGAALLIDECDALLGRRSEVKDAHDRYANIEVAYLLQRCESFPGLAMFNTNMRQNIDPAFLRRLRFIIEFPRPDQASRERIWRQCIPDNAHTLDDAAFRQLARRIDLTGGHIRQITLRAAFIAAAADEQIGLSHLAHAARFEFAKLGMPPVELDCSSSRQAA